MLNLTRWDGECLCKRSDSGSTSHGTMVPQSLRGRVDAHSGSACSAYHSTFVYRFRALERVPYQHSLQWPTDPSTSLAFVAICLAGIAAASPSHAPCFPPPHTASPRKLTPPSARSRAPLRIVPPPANLSSRTSTPDTSPSAAAWRYSILPRSGWSCATTAGINIGFCPRGGGTRERRAGGRRRGRGSRRWVE